jgi:hypothetical protein
MHYKTSKIVDVCTDDDGHADTKDGEPEQYNVLDLPHAVQ